MRTYSGPTAHRRQSDPACESDTRASAPHISDARSAVCGLHHVCITALRAALLAGLALTALLQPSVRPLSAAATPPLETFPNNTSTPNNVSVPNSMSIPNNMSKQPSDLARLPAFYRLVFLYLEPISICAGAVEAFFFQSAYLSLTHAPSAPALVPVSTSIVLTQLANLYLGLGLTEALILRVTSEYRVWRALITVLLIADVGHLYSVLPLGFSRAFLQWWNWNAIDWGNVGWVYFLALTRICMLLGIGFGRSGQKSA